MEDPNLKTILNSSSKGGTMAEYAAMAFLVIVVVVAVFMLLGISIGDLIRQVANIF